MKASEIREMSISDLRERIEAEKANLDTMKINHAISPLEDTSKIRKASGQQQDGQVCRCCSRNEGKTPCLREIR